jgi:DNA-binding NtrC family response regulator
MVEVEVHTRVLVVEDDAEVSRGIVRRLKSDRHDVELSSDPVEVLQRISNGFDEWDVVLLDVGLPDISGIEVLRKMRDAGLHASVIMLTGDDSASTAIECMRSGAFHYLTKPFRIYELSSIVESGARFAKLRRELDRMTEASGTSLAVGTQELLLPPGESDLLPLSEAKRQLITSFEQSYVSRVLRRSKGSVPEAARLAGLDRASFQRLMQRYNIDPSSFE